jgi:hypothetical protein
VHRDHRLVPEPCLGDTVLREVCDLLAATDGGLTNKEIAELLARVGIRDPTPRTAGPGTYIAKNKRDRLYDALRVSQLETRSGDKALTFVKRALAPARYSKDPALLEARRREVNVPLAFAALEVTESGGLKRGTQAGTLTEARRRAARLRDILTERDAHPRLLAACVEEIDDDNYFHAVLEGSKSLAAEIQRRTSSHRMSRRSSVRSPSRTRSISSPRCRICNVASTSASTQAIFAGSCRASQALRQRGFGCAARSPRGSRRLTIAQRE